MIAYVAFVAVFNVMLGMLLGRIMPPEYFGFHRTPLKSRQSDEPDAIADFLEGNAAFPTNSLPGQPGADASPAESVTDVETTGQFEASVKSPAPAKLWADFAQQLGDVKSRANYCRSAQNMRLVRQAAEQLKVCSQVWYAQLEQCLAEEQVDGASQAFVMEVDLTEIEMFAAQIESTITNLTALSFTGSVDDALNSLDREINLLDDQQKQIARRKKNAKNNSTAERPVATYSP